MSPKLKNIAALGAAVVVTAAIIFLTPLHYINIIAPSMHEVSPQELQSEYQANPSHYTLIDVRPPVDYQQGHVPHSINIPIYELVDKWPSLPHAGTTMVLICGDGRLATVAYGYLQYHGFFNLQHLTNGFNAWAAAQLPVVTGGRSY